MLPRHSENVIVSAASTRRLAIREAKQSSRRFVREPFNDAVRLQIKSFMEAVTEPEAADVEVRFIYNGV
jgi:hypothetical protein